MSLKMNSYLGVSDLISVAAGVLGMDFQEILRVGSRESWRNGMERLEDLFFCSVVGGRVPATDPVLEE